MSELTAASWPPLPPDAEITIVKLRPDGSEAARYPGRVLAAHAPADWLAARAIWTRDAIELDGLQFLPGDHLHEFFSLSQPFNCFSVFTADGTLRGWYANVTHPTTFVLDAGHLTLFWHDLYLDIIALPDGTVTVRDEDELATSGLEQQNPELHAKVLRARDRLLQLLTARDVPFHERSPSTP
jgi:hypothetical protein